MSLLSKIRKRIKQKKDRELEKAAREIMEIVWQGKTAAHSSAQSTSERPQKGHRRPLTKARILSFINDVKGRENKRGPKFKMMVLYRTQKLVKKYGYVMREDIGSRQVRFLWKVRRAWIKGRKKEKKFTGIFVLVKGSPVNPIVYIEQVKFNSVEKFIRKRGYFICPQCNRLRALDQEKHDGRCAFCHYAEEQSKRFCQFCGSDKGEKLGPQYAYLSKYGYDFTRYICPECRDKLNKKAVEDITKPEPEKKCSICGRRLVHETEVKEGICGRCYELQDSVMYDFEPKIILKEVKKGKKTKLEYGYDVDPGKWYGMCACGCVGIQRKNGKYMCPKCADEFRTKEIVLKCECGRELKYQLEMEVGKCYRCMNQVEALKEVKKMSKLSRIKEKVKKALNKMKGVAV